GCDRAAADSRGGRAHQLRRPDRSRNLQRGRVGHAARYPRTVGQGAISLMRVTTTCLLALSLAGRWLAAQTVPIGTADIAGVVTGPNGPEAGVWVIAETHDLPTKFVRIVVTDDQGRYLVPDLPKATYSVWVRGYGLVDSPKVSVRPGKTVNLTAVAAPTPRAAAEYYPAGYWLSLMRIPEQKQFTATAADANGMSPNVKSQAEWVRIVKSGGCLACHTLGTKGTRELPVTLGHFATSVAAWDRRIQSGQAG